MMDNKYDVIVVGSGAAGMMSAIIAGRAGKKVLLLEKLSKLGAKLKATGGGRCNLTNTLSNEDFMQRFGRDGRFMMPALKALDHQALRDFFQAIGVESHAPDGYRVFPITHSSSTILDALEKEMIVCGVEIITSAKVESLLQSDMKIEGLQSVKGTFYSDNVILATGGMGYPVLGAEGDGHEMVEKLGHKVTDLFPAMMPLLCKEDWLESCRADTIAKVELKVALKKYKKLKAKGDLIFTKNGIRGPVVLDFSREITPLLHQFEEVPLLMNLTKGMNEEDLQEYFKNKREEDPHKSVLEYVQTLLPASVSLALCTLAGVKEDESFSKLAGHVKAKLISILAWTPLTVTGHDGWKLAMITRGGVTLKEINPETMQSKLLSGLYFCGEVMNLDGPCGGYNLQWSFASGHIAGQLKS